MIDNFDTKSFRTVEKFCMFVGYPRSGHSLIGSLLDAHPNAVIAHELDALLHVDAGIEREQLFRLLLDASNAFTRSGRNWQGYSYEVPGQWQGRYKEIKVIGDKKGGASSTSLRTNPDLLVRLRQTVGVEIAYVHVIRNPYDNISTMYNRRRNQDLDVVSEAYFSRCDAVADIKTRVEPGTLLDVRFELFVQDPMSQLRKLCNFLSLKCEDDYLQACTGTVFSSPSKTRHTVQWSTKDIDAVQERIDMYPFLQGYSYRD